MAHVDIHLASNKTDTEPDKPMGKTIPLTPEGVGGSTWEQE